MNRIALALLSLALVAPAGAQDSRPAEKTPAKKTEKAPAKKTEKAPAKKTEKTPAKKSKKVSVNKDASLKLIHQLCLAMEKKDVKGALALCATPFRVVSDGKLVEWKAKELEQALAGKFGQRIGERAMSFRKKGAEEQTALYWGPKSKRGKATQTKYEPFKGAGWVGVVYKGKKKKPEEAKKPFAIQVVDGQLKVIGFHDD